MDYDLINNGNWETCTLPDGTQANNKDMTAFTWRRFLTQWSATLDIDTNSNNCLLRTRIKYRPYQDGGNNIWSPYGYYGPFTITPTATSIFSYYKIRSTVIFHPDAYQSYPKSLVKVTPGFDVKEYPDGNVEVDEYFNDINDYVVQWPVITPAEMVDYEAFLVEVDGSRNSFLYTTFEDNESEPGEIKRMNVWVKFINDSRRKLRSGDWSVMVKLRKAPSSFPAIVVPII